jgi:hypothetical protein
MTLSAVRSLLFLALILLPGAARAQTSNSPSTAAAQHLLKSEELEQLVAPIALYPDGLLSEVLMASTYPLEVVQAERWVKANNALKDDALKAAVDKQDWDDSIKSLVATPSVLEMMSAKLDWTQKLGDAVIAQQTDVMDAVQQLRMKAEANNKLNSTKEQSVTVKEEQGKRIIAIAPTDPGTVYVPYYDPSVVYGTWPYPSYPPYYWPQPGYIAAGIIATGIAFGAGYALGRWASGGYWGGSVNWSNSNITINRPGGGNIGGGNWNRGAHVEHRRAGGNRGGRHEGLNFRGRNGQQVLRPGGGQGHHAATRPSGGHRGANRPTAHTRPSRGAAGAGHRPAAGHRAAGRAGHGGGGAHRGGGGMRAHGGGGRGGGGARGGGGRGGGGGRRSDIRLKHDIVYLGRLDDGLGFYRFSYDGSDTAYVGVIAQDVQSVVPRAVFAGRDGYLRVNYQKLGLTFETYDAWIRSGAKIPPTVRIAP